MAKVLKNCKVCGKQYEYCHTLRKSNVFRWQDVACSVECGEKYFDLVQEARGLIKKPRKSEKKAISEDHKEDTTEEQI